MKKLVAVVAILSVLTLPVVQSSNDTDDVDPTSNEDGGTGFNYVEINLV